VYFKTSAREFPNVWDNARVIVGLHPDQVLPMKFKFIFYFKNCAIETFIIAFFLCANALIVEWIL
jgi:hypothetical protein